MTPEEKIETVFGGKDLLHALQSSQELRQYLSCSPQSIVFTLAVDLADYNLPIAWSNYKMPRFSLYGGTPPKLASGSDNGGNRPRIIPHTELASSVRHRMLPLYHFLSLYFYLSLYLTIGEADLNLFHPQRWPHQSETGRWQIQGQGLMYLKKCGKRNQNFW